MEASKYHKIPYGISGIIDTDIEIMLQMDDKTLKGMQLVSKSLRSIYLMDDVWRRKIQKLLVVLLELADRREKNLEVKEVASRYIYYKEESTVNYKQIYEVLNSDRLFYMRNPIVKCIIGDILFVATKYGAKNLVDIAIMYRKIKFSICNDGQAMWNAIAHGDLDFVKYLIKDDTVWPAAAYCCKSHMMAAAETGNYDMYQYIISKYTDYKPYMDQQLLVSAINGKNIKIITDCIEKIPDRIYNSDLLRSICTSSIEIAEFLLEYRYKKYFIGASIQVLKDIIPAIRMPMLMLLSKYNPHLPQVPSVVNPIIFTYFPRPEVIDYLLENGFILNDKIIIQAVKNIGMSNCVATNERTSFHHLLSRYNPSKELISVMVAKLRSGYSTEILRVINNYMPDYIMPPDILPLLDKDIKLSTSYTHITNILTNVLSNDSLNAYVRVLNGIMKEISTQEDAALEIVKIVILSGKYKKVEKYLYDCLTTGRLKICEVILQHAKTLGQKCKDKCAMVVFPLAKGKEESAYTRIYHLLLELGANIPTEEEFTAFYIELLHSYKSYTYRY